MSSEAQVSPYDERNRSYNQSDNTASDVLCGAAGLACQAAAVITVGAARLAAKSLLLNEKQKEVLKQKKETERIARVKSATLKKPDLVSLPLRTVNAETLMRSAARLGFKEECSAGKAVAAKHEKRVTLCDPYGEKITLRKSESGSLVLESRKTSAPIHRVVQQHSVDQTVKALKQKCRSITVRKQQDGSVLIEASEQRHGQKDGTATIKTHVSCEGAASIDVSGIRGKRCEKIINELQQAIGGRRVAGKRKKAYFQEPTTEQDHIRV